MKRCKEVIDLGKYYKNKKIKSLEELKKYNNRYNSITRKVLGFKNPNEVLEEYNKNRSA